eukprot:gene631-2065_t
MPGGLHELALGFGIPPTCCNFFPRTKLFHVNKMCHWMTYFFASETMLEFFKTGEFKWKIPISGTVIRYSDPTAPSKLDWWGINYYSRTRLSGHEAGLYDSIAEASILGKPIFITETGLADKADKHRRWFIQTHFCMIMKAISDGYDVRGVYFWTLMDNIEWHEGFHIKFGLFEWNPDPTVNCMGLLWEANFGRCFWDQLGRCLWDQFRGCFGRLTLGVASGTNLGVASGTNLGVALGG